MSIAAAGLVTVGLPKSGSDQVPDLRILPGRYMTALWPLIGLLATIVHVPVVRSRVRLTMSGPPSNSLPLGSTNMNGYSALRRCAEGIDVHVLCSTS